MNKEELMLQKHLIDLSETAYKRDIVTFSDFLNLNELNILHSTPKNMFSANYETYGGYEASERQMVAFLPDALCYEFLYPFSVLRIRPLNKKFSEDLTHRDYLGAILNLGIERCKIGDILVNTCEAVVFVSDHMSDFLAQNLTRIRHTPVVASIEELQEFQYEPSFEEIRGTVASVRLDTLLALAFSSSRSRLSGLIEGKKVFVNGRMIVSNGYRLKEGDIISVRGMGKFCYDGVLSETRKGRYSVVVRKYS